MFGKKDPENLPDNNEELDLPESKGRVNYVLYIVCGAYGLLQGGRVFKNIVIDGQETTTNPVLLVSMSVLLMAVGVFLFYVVIRSYIRQSRETKEWELIEQQESLRSRQDMMTRAAASAVEEAHEETGEAEAAQGETEEAHREAKEAHGEAEEAHREAGEAIKEIAEAADEKKE